MSNLTGVLLLNLGTPDHHHPKAVGRYLREFLVDPRVIELPGWLRWLLVNCIITPFRSKQSAHAYKKIWHELGSPLLINSQNLRDKLAQKLGDDYCVALGMRYGAPNINSAIKQLEAANVKEIILLPLFPQYASAATGSALQKSLEILAKHKVISHSRTIKNFFQDPGYIQALAASVKPYLTSEFDYVLMSYHGLPERQMIHHGNTNCDMRNACPAINATNHNCYRAQCYQTSRLLAASLQLPETKWGVAFQSRLGKLPWIQPYTDLTLEQLRQRGVSKLVVCCPSFVADCLETLEEIGIRAKEQWHSLGGAELRLVPCLNDDPQWVESLANIIAN